MEYACDYFNEFSATYSFLRKPPKSYGLLYWSLLSYMFISKLVYINLFNKIRAKQALYNCNLNLNGKYVNS